MDLSALDLNGLDLSAQQLRTLERLIGLEERPQHTSELRDELRARMEAAIGDRTTPGGVWIGKTRVSEHARCEGLLAADVLEEGAPFVHDRRSATGKLAHRAIQADVEVGGTKRVDEPHEVAELAVRKLLEADRESEFRDFWEGTEEGERREIVADAARLLARFREVFPPLRDLRRELQPAAEFRVKTQLSDGVVLLSGYVDLSLGRPEKGRASRLFVDHKTGGAYPEHAEDLRYYALVHTLQHGAPPYRLASFFAESGEWQAEDVDVNVLEHAADRTAAAAKRAIDFLEGDEATELNPGPWCGWCPRARSCPESAATGSQN